MSNKIQSKRVAEAMAADKVWDKQHNIAEHSFQDRAIDAAVAKRAKKGQ